MLKNLTLVFGCLMGFLTHSASAQTYFSQDFSNVTGAYPTGWTRHNLDALTPNAGVATFNFGTNAWVCRALGGDSALISTSWYTSPGQSDDWAFTPAITIPAAGTNTRLYWNGLALDAGFRDGYEVYIRTTAPTNLNVASSTLLLTVPEEDSFWQARNLSLAAYAGQTVYIGFRNNSNDMAALAIDDVVVANTITPAPANDNCSGAVALTVGATCSAVAGSVIGTTASGVAACAGTAEDDVWYKFVATSTSATVNVQGSADFDAVFRVYSGVCGTPTAIGTCTDATASGGVETATLTGLTVGQTYYIQVFDYDNALPPTTNFAICVQSAAASVANDNCTGAISLTHGTTCTPVSGTTQSATSSGMTNACGGTSEDDVWYSFVATSPRAIVAVGGAASFDAVVEVYSGACATLTSMDCADENGNGGVESVTYASLTVGQTYYVRVYDYAATASATPNFNICISSFNACSITIPAGTTPENEACAASANNGCSVTPTAFQSITCGQTIAGTTWANNGTRDLDYYRFTVATADTVFFDLASEAPIYLLLGTAVCPFTVTGNASVNACGSGSFSIYMTPGTYYAIIAHQSFNGWACSANANDYVFGLRFKTTPLANTATVNGTCATGAGAGVAALGGFAPFTYLWSNGATTSNISGLMASGNYTVTVTNSNTCKTTATASVSYTSTTITANNVVNPTTCGGATGSINITPSNGTAPYTFMWSNNRTTQNVTGLAAGAYSVTVTDANGCTGAITGLNVTSANPPVVNATTSAATCTGANGSVSLSISGGVTPYNFVWSNSRTTQNINGVTTGAYSVTVTDANGCSVTTSATVAQNSVVISANASASPASCGNAVGSISLVLNNGTAPYTFVWSNGRTIQNIASLAAGSYSVTITDANGCTGSVANINVSSTSAPTANASALPATCTALNGSVSLAVAGGATPYTFMWSNGRTTQNINGVAAGAYSVTVTDANSCTVAASATVTNNGVNISASASTTQTGCTTPTGTANLTLNNGTAPYMFMWSNGRTTQNLAALSAGSYNVTITDANGCTGSVTNVNITSAGGPTVGVTSTDVSCPSGTNGTITLTPSGGTTPYTIVWSIGNVGQLTATGLAANTYTATVTDANNCAFSISRIINQPSPISVTLNSTNIACNGQTNGFVNLSATGGTGAYTFRWSNGALTQNISNLGVGSYTATVTDANACSVTSSAANISQPTVLSVPNTINQITCNGAANGMVTLNPAGGTTPYAFLWSNGATTNVLSGLGVGTYSATVTDANNCRSSSTYTITQPSVLSVLSSSTNVLCNGGASGAISLNVSGGTTPYGFMWSNGASVANPSGLSAGTYSGTVTDAQGCSSNAAFTLTQPSALSVSISSAAANCLPNGSATLTVSGGTPAYMFMWSNGATIQNLSGLAGGTYTATITDANLCASVATTTVTNIGSSINVSSTVTQPTTANNGAVAISVTGGAAPYTFAWSNGRTTQNISGVGAGSYAVTVTDANGCLVTTNAQLNLPVSVQEANNNQTIGVELFPNPSTGLATLRINTNNQQAELSIQVFSSTGQQLVSYQAQTNDVFAQELNLEAFADGLYFVRVQANNTVSTHKLLIAR